MPELPDVENFRRYVDANALNRTIAGIRVLNVRILHGVTEGTLNRALVGQCFTSSRRHGKHLLVRIGEGPWLTCHFGMTGRLVCFERLEDEPRYDRFRLDFGDGGHLAYDSRRMLGGIGLADDADAFLEEHGLGPDALDSKLTEETFVAAIAGRRGGIKRVLMDQSLIAGIGNVYSDEILFQAGLNPKADLRKLDGAQRTRLYRSMRDVLKTAVEKGAGSEELTERLPGGYLLPQRHRDGCCPRCGGNIRTMKVAGRTAYYCPRCQPD